MLLTSTPYCPRTGSPPMAAWGFLSARNQRGKRGATPSHRQPNRSNKTILRPSTGTPSQIIAHDRTKSIRELTKGGAKIHVLNASGSSSPRKDHRRFRSGDFYRIPKSQASLGKFYRQSGYHRQKIPYRNQLLKFKCGTKKRKKPSRRGSFCGLPRIAVEKLLSGPDSYIWR